MQAVNHVQAVVEGIELLAASFFAEQFAERPLDRRQLLASGAVLGIQALAQLCSGGLGDGSGSRDRHHRVRVPADAAPAEAPAAEAPAAE